MSFEIIRERLSETGRYSSRIEEDILRVESVGSGSEYVVEEFCGSFQIRQAVQFNCQADDILELKQIHALCSTVNERFSGCKCFVDQWGVLVNAFDWITEILPPNVIEVAFDQVELVSQVLLELLEFMKTTNRLPTTAEIEAAFEVPSLQ